MQVKRRRQALHLDRVTLEEQQVEEEGETWSWVFLKFTWVFFSKSLLLRARAKASFSMCAVRLSTAFN